VSYRLGNAEDTAFAGTLNSYARTPDGFDEEAREIGLVLAAHATVAVRVVQERAALENVRENLQLALTSRDVIGQAKGVLMERLRLTPDDAFDVLRRASQRLNVKLRDVAQQLAETGQLDDRKPTAR